MSLVHVPLDGGSSVRALPHKVLLVLDTRSGQSGVDFEYFAFDESRRANSRMAWGIPPEAHVVGSLGRLVRHKRVDLLLRAFARLREVCPQEPLYCVIAGTGPELERLRQLATELQITTHVRFVGWIEECRDAYCAFDVLCMPSEDEGLGMVLIEAGACGCIPLAASAGGMPEVLAPIGGGLVVPTWRVVDWAASIETQLARTPGDRSMLRARLRSRLQLRFDAVTRWHSTIEWTRQTAKARAGNA